MSSGVKKVTIVSYCRYADLLGTIFGEDRNKLRIKLGLPTRYGLCPNCGEPLNNSMYLYCSKGCWRESRLIEVSCSQCGRLFKHSIKNLIWKTQKGQKYWFCSQQCLGKRAGKHYGFLAHPENIGEIKKKWGWLLTL